MSKPKDVRSTADTIKIDVAIGTILALMLAAAVFGLTEWISRPRDPFAQPARALAADLGVRIGDYPHPVSFPVGYFFDVLQEDMSVADVHAVVQGYTRVLRCGDHTEIYYYYTVDDDTARRFIVFYNKGQFSRLQAEDSKSRTIFVDGCQNGLLPEN